jgi:phytoene/squalene synthetase
MVMTIERADACYRRSAPLDAMVRAGGRPTLWAMTAIYQGLLAQIRADPQRVAERGRVRLSALRKGAIAIRAKWLSRFLWRGPASGNVGARAGNVSA